MKKIVCLLLLTLLLMLGACGICESPLVMRKPSLTPSAGM